MEASASGQWPFSEWKRRGVVGGLHSVEERPTPRVPPTRGQWTSPLPNLSTSQTQILAKIASQH